MKPSNKSTIRTSREAKQGICLTNPGFTILAKGDCMTEKSKSKLIFKMGQDSLVIYYIYEMTIEGFDTLFDSTAL